MELPRLQETLFSLHWWVTVIVGSFLMSVFAGYAIKWLDRTATRMSFRWRERREQARQERADRIARAADDSHAFLATLALEQRLYTAAVLTVLGFASVFAWDNFHLVFALNRKPADIFFFRTVEVLLLLRWAWLSWRRFLVMQEREAVEAARKE